MLVVLWGGWWSSSRWSFVVLLILMFLIFSFILHRLMCFVFKHMVMTVTIMMQLMTFWLFEWITICPSDLFSLFVSPPLTHAPSLMFFLCLILRFCVIPSLCRPASHHLFLDSCYPHRISLQTKEKKITMRVRKDLFPILLDDDSFRFSRMFCPKEEKSFLRVISVRIFLFSSSFVSRQEWRMRKVRTGRIEKGWGTGGEDQQQEEKKNRVWENGMNEWMNPTFKTYYFSFALIPLNESSKREGRRNGRRENDLLLCISSMCLISLLILKERRTILHILLSLDDDDDVRFREEKRKRQKTSVSYAWFKFRTGIHEHHDDALLLPVLSFSRFWCSIWTLNVKLSFSLSDDDRHDVLSIRVVIRFAWREERRTISEKNEMRGGKRSLCRVDVEFRRRKWGGKRETEVLNLSQVFQRENCVWMMIGEGKDRESDSPFIQGSQKNRDQEEERRKELGKKETYNGSETKKNCKSSLTSVSQLMSAVRHDFA